MALSTTTAKVYNDHSSNPTWNSASASNVPTTSGVVRVSAGLSALVMRCSRASSHELTVQFSPFSTQKAYASKSVAFIMGSLSTFCE